MKVAAAQVQSVALDLEANLNTTVAAIREAAAEGALIVVLPECVSSGWLDDPSAVRPLAEPADGSGPTLRAWSEVAAETGTAVIAGFPEAVGKKLFNSVAVIDSSGELLGTYRKLHLFGSEREVFEPGDHGLPIFEPRGPAGRRPRLLRPPLPGGDAAPRPRRGRADRGADRLGWRVRLADPGR